MARASYVYIVGPDHDGGEYAYTVKHEALRFAGRHYTALKQAGAKVRRLPDGGPVTGRTAASFSLDEFLA
jgi:hypothetical protein